MLFANNVVTRKKHINSFLENIPWRDIKQYQFMIESVFFHVPR